MPRPPSGRATRTMSGSDLIWPPERPRVAAPGSEWSQARSNLCLDFHGDPASAQLAVFSDGNHHMALAECVEAFVRRNPGLHEVFYTTTPPSVYLAWMRTGELTLGNLTLRVHPNVVIGPRDVVERLHAEGETGAPVAFARSRGNAYLVRAGNPKGIRGVADLLRPDVIPFMSNPETEAASYGVYRETMLAMARIRGLDVEALERRLSGEGGDIVFGERIHHREAPQALADGRADVAMVYYHLALRYVRVFPWEFEMVCEGWDPEGDDNGDEKPAEGMVVTAYAVAPAREVGKWGNGFVTYMRLDDAVAIYEEHGIQSVRG